jgi:phosphatidylserine decarboxylase
VFAPGAGRFLGPVAAAAALFALFFGLGFWPAAATVLLGLFLLAAALGVFLGIFFRDPDRAPGAGIVSAADGRVRAVERDGDCWRISVFMNVTNVHVNRFPVEGTVESIATVGTEHRPAYRADAGHNVQRSYRLSTPVGPVEVVQMTGILARRLVSFVAVGSSGRKGDRLGMIVLGSRVDVRISAAHATPTVTVGDRVRAGESTVARELP